MEFWILSHLPDSDYFVKLLGILLTNSHVVLVFDAITNGIELYEYLNKYGTIDEEEEAKEICFNIASAISLLHSMGIIHRDFKLENIFLLPLESGVTIKIVDFGLSTYLPLDNASEIISYELRKEWEHQLIAFWELLFECGRRQSFLKDHQSLYAIKNDNNQPPVSLDEDIKTNWDFLLQIIYHPKPLLSIFTSNKNLYGQTMLIERSGSEEYAAPELLLSTNDPYSPQLSEIWSLGVVFYAIFTGRFPFQYTSSMAFRLAIAKGLVEWPNKHYPSNGARSLIENMLCVSAHERPSLASLLSSPWFS